MTTEITRPKGISVHPTLTVPARFLALSTERHRFLPPVPLNATSTIAVLTITPILAAFIAWAM
ncbi:MAG: hypothetical protein JO345_39145 [Streptosporangiaceae bacterium]|nr:hypothetical protein [Streptosporangiaceae bacterium]